MFGATRFTNSSHLLAIEGSKLVKPVRLPPGRVKLWTTPAVTGSLTWTNTVGVVRVFPLPPTDTGVDWPRTPPAHKPSLFWATGRPRPPPPPPQGKKKWTW